MSCEEQGTSSTRPFKKTVKFIRTLNHPLMNVRDLDAPALDLDAPALGRRRRQRSRRGRRQSGSGQKFSRDPRSGRGHWFRRDQGFSRGNRRDHDFGSGHGFNRDARFGRDYGFYRGRGNRDNGFHRGRGNRDYGFHRGRGNRDHERDCGRYNLPENIPAGALASEHGRRKTPIDERSLPYYVAEDLEKGTAWLEPWITAPTIVSFVEPSFSPAPVSQDLALSESDESDGEPASKRTRYSLSPTTSAPKFDDSTKLLLSDLRLSSDSSSSSSSSTYHDSTKLLLSDLRLSSDSPSSSSSTHMHPPPDVCVSSTSSFSAEISCPTLSDGEPDEYTLIRKNRFLKDGSLKKPRELWLKFNQLKLGDRSELLKTFMAMLWYYPLDFVAHWFIDKFKLLQMKEAVNELKSLYPHFIDTSLFPLGSGKWLFGSIVLNLIIYWCEKSEYHVALKLLNVLEVFKIDPLRARKFYKPGRRDYRLTTIKLTNQTEAALLCGEIYIAMDDLRHCAITLGRCLTMLIVNEIHMDLEHIMPFVKKVFRLGIEKRQTSALRYLFLDILEAQGGLEAPIDLTSYYNAILCIHLGSKDEYCVTQALKMFDLVSGFSYYEASAIAFRGLLTVSAMRREPLSRISKIFRFCVNCHAFPSHDPQKWLIQLYSSMSKLEMQIYIIQCLISYTKEIRAERLNACKTFLTFEILQVFNTMRGYIYTTHPLIGQVNHSLCDAIRRFKATIRLYLKAPAHITLYASGSNKFIMFADVLADLLFATLKFDNEATEKQSLSRKTTSSHCPLCCSRWRWSYPQRSREDLLAYWKSKKPEDFSINVEWDSDDDVDIDFEIDDDSWLTLPVI